MASELLQISLQTFSKKDILEKVDEFLKSPGEMKHIVSLNPEILVLSKEDEGFRLILQSANLRLNDGVGVVLASKWKGITGVSKYTGVDFMNDLIGHIEGRSLRVLFLGGKPELADKLADRYKKLSSTVQFHGLTGIKDINKYQQAQEGVAILKEIAVYKPHIIFASFGSPFQEKWFWDNKNELKGIICVGVGGAFDFVAGTVPRAPAFLRSIGLEWLFRLIMQPWRWKRQLRLLTFIKLVLLNK